MFSIEKVNFSYGKKKILKDLSFSVEEGKFLSIIGPNGSGKTTLLNILTGFSENHSGTVKFMGKKIETYSLESRARNFSVIRQSGNIKFPFTCVEIVMMGRNPFRNRMKKLSKKDMDIIYEAMEITDTLKFADSLITEVSGGEYQRILFARALAQKPKVLFLDEAFSAMDVSYRIKSLNILKELVKKQNLTVVSIMHDLNLAYSFSDNVIVLKEAKIAGKGNPKSIMTPDLIDFVFEVNVCHIKNKGLIVVP